MLLVTRSLAGLVEPGRARALHDENLRLARETVNPRIEASTRAALAMTPSTTTGSTTQS